MRGMSPDRTPPESSRERGLVAARLGMLLAAILLYGAVWGSLDVYVRSIDDCDLLFCDFVRHFGPQGEVLPARPKPVQGFFYGPFAAVFFWGISAFPNPLLAWGVLQVAFIIALHEVGDRLLGGGRWLRLAYTALFLASVPVLHNFKWGQVSVLITLAVLLSFLLAARGKAAGAGAALAFAVGFKSYPVLFALGPLLRRDWRTLGQAGGFLVLFMGVIPALAMGPEAALGFYQSVAKVSAAVLERFVPFDANSQHLPHVFRRWDTGLVVGGALSRAISLLVGALGLLAAARGGARRDEASLAAALLVAIPFLVPTSWPHYFVFLPLCQAVALRELAARGAGPARLLGLVGVALSAVLGSVVGLWSAGSFAAWSRAGLPLLAVLPLLPVLWRDLLGPAAAPD